MRNLDYKPTGSYLKLIYIYSFEQLKEMKNYKLSNVCIQAKDSGRWKCNVGVVENSEVTTASGMANITIATPPSDVYLEEPFHQLHSNFSYGE